MAKNIVIYSHSDSDIYALIEFPCIMLGFTSDFLCYSKLVPSPNSILAKDKSRGAFETCDMKKPEGKAIYSVQEMLNWLTVWSTCSVLTRKL